MGGYSGGTSRLARPVQRLPEPDIRPSERGCLLDRGLIPATGYIVWPYFTFSPDGTSIYISDGDGILEYTYTGLSLVGTYATSLSGQSVSTMGTKASGDVVWFETNFSGNWTLRQAGSTLTTETGDWWSVCVSPYDDEIYAVKLEGLELSLWRLDGSTFTLISAAPAGDVDFSSTRIQIVGTLDGGLWVTGGNGSVGRFDIPTTLVRTSPGNDEPGGGAYPDGSTTISLLPRPDGTVDVVAMGGAGRALTWDPDALAITVADHDCLDGYVGGASGYTPDLSVVAFWDGNDEHLYELV